MSNYPGVTTVIMFIVGLILVGEVLSHFLRKLFSMEKIYKRNNSKNFILLSLFFIIYLYFYT